MDAIAWKQSVGEPRVLISRRALLHNARVVRRHLAPGTKVCAVVKADAYGHGAALVADALCNLSDAPPGAPARPAADALAVASLDEAAVVDTALATAAGAIDPSAPPPGATGDHQDAPTPQSPTEPSDDYDYAAPVPILVFRPIENVFLGRQRARLEEAVRRRWVLTVCSTTAADDLARIAVGCGRRASVQVMIDSGMTRSGVLPDGLAALLRKIESRPSLRLVGLCTHFASADEPENTFAAEQLERFTDAARAAGVTAAATIEPSAVPPGAPRPRLLRHAANTGAIFFLPPSHLDMVRPGLCLYGIDPLGRPCLDRPLRPALRWTAPLVGIKEIAPGATVGYGQTWRALRRSRVGLVPVGYADGYPRCYSNRAVMMIHNRPAAVIGRVSMDLTTIDLTEIPQAIVGDEVTLLDSDPLSPASAYKLAEWAETIPYEVFCRIGPRVRRVAYDPEDDSPRQPERRSSTRPDAA